VWVEKEGTTVERIVIGEYKFYQSTNNIQNKDKIVILYHGWGGTAKGYIDLAEEIAQEGFGVLIPDILNHDERYPLENHFDSNVTRKYFWNTVFHTINDYNEFLRVIGVKKNSTILVGNSMGGFIANGIFAKEPEISGLANINGSGSFVLTEKIFRIWDGRDEMSQEEESRLKKYDPIDKMISLSPILLMHGDSDTIIPIEGQKNYYKYITKEEKRTNVEMEIFEKVNHEFTPKMVQKLITWLKEIKN
jgi:uncharacterized protein